MRTNETADTRHEEMRLDEVSALRREVTRLRDLVAKLEAQLARDERREARKLRSVG